MNKINTDSNTSISLDNKILQEQVRMLYEGMTLSLTATVVISTILCYLMWGQVESSQSIVLWFSFLMVITLVRAWDTFLYKKRQRGISANSHWKNRFFIGSTSAGIWWGLTIWFMFPADNSYVVILVLIVVGIVSGATSVLSFRWETMFAFMLCALGLPALKLVYVGGEFFQLLALLMIIFFLFATSSTKRIYQNTQQNVRLRIESTAREQALNYAQQKQLLHAQQTPLAVMEWNLDLKVSEWNPSAEKIFGYKRDEMLGQSVIDSIIEKSSIHQVEKYWQELLDSKKSLEGIIIENKTSDGSRIFCEWFVTPLVDNNDNVVGITAQVLDITAQKKADAELVLAKETAEKASKAKSEFLASMSHELRTPLNAILGFAQLLELEQGMEPQQKESVLAIYTAGNHLLDLINELLDLARIEAGRLELSLEPLSLEKLLDECKDLIAPLANNQNIQVQFDSGSCHCMVYADYTRLKQVLLNLLSNAVKYNRDKGSVWVSCSTDNEDYRKISVTDTGHGIDKSRLPDLFESFNRLGAEASGIEGTGIGLVITRQLIEAMGGSIDVESVVGEGSTFSLTVPQSKADITGVEIARIDSTESPMIVDDTQHTILYIEDNPTNLRLVQQIIGMRPDTSLLDALSAERGLKIALSHHPDLILMDINLPGMNGYEALKRLREQPETCNIPVIAVTANAMKRDIERFHEAGFDDYITKPIDIKLMMETLDRVMHEK